MNIAVNHECHFTSNQTNTGSERTRKKRETNRDNQRASKEARAFATSPLKGKYDEPGQFGALVLKRGKFIYGEVPYDLMKTSRKFGTLERNLRHAYSMMGTPLYGVHLTSPKKGRIFVTRKSDRSNFTVVHPWRSMERVEGVPKPVIADVLLTVIEKYHATQTKILSMGLGFCLQQEEQVIGMLPVKFLKESNNSSECIHSLYCAYACLSDWGSFEYGWIVSYTNEQTRIPHIVFVAMENDEQTNETRLKVYHSRANMTDRMREKCRLQIGKKLATYRQKEAKNDGE